MALLRQPYHQTGQEIDLRRQPGNPRLHQPGNHQTFLTSHRDLVQWEEVVAPWVVVQEEEAVGEDVNIYGILQKSNRNHPQNNLKD
jgi:hypothetical protein